MLKRMIPLFLGCGLIIFTGFSNTPNKAVNVLNDMLDAIEQYDQLSYTLKAWERIEGESTYTELVTKLQEEPKRKMYLKNKSKPNKGVEILWIEGKWNGNAKVYPNGIPYMNLNLSPYGNQMRENQHHTIHSTGFGFLSEIVKEALNRAKKRGGIDEVFHYESTVNHNDRQCHKVLIKDPTFSFEPYTVQQGEDLDDIANRRKICAYLIIEKNEDVDDFDDVSKGQTIQIPTSYAKKTILYIDTENMLPIGQHMYDEKGRFERYEYLNVNTNPSFSDKEFTTEYEDYNFW